MGNHIRRIGAHFYKWAAAEYVSERVTPALGSAGSTAAAVSVAIIFEPLPLGTFLSVVITIRHIRRCISQLSFIPRRGALDGRRWMFRRNIAGFSFVNLKHYPHVRLRDAFCSLRYTWKIINGNMIYEFRVPEGTFMNTCNMVYKNHRQNSVTHPLGKDRTSNGMC